MYITLCLMNVYLNERTKLLHIQVTNKNGTNCLMCLSKHTENRMWYLSHIRT